MRIPCLGEVSNTKILVGAVVIAASVYCAGPGLGEKFVEHIATPFLNAAAEAASGANMAKLAENVSIGSRGG